jgi:iron complex outermembrane receptor protein
VWTGNAVIDYGFPIGKNTLRPRLKLAYVDSQYASLFEIPFYYIPPRTLLDANLDYEAGNWLWSLYGTNVTNKLYVSSNDGTNIYYGNPRQWGVRMQYTFAGSGN